MGSACLQSANPTATAVLIVVPVEEGAAEGTRILDAAEALRKVGAILEGFARADDLPRATASGTLRDHDAAQRLDRARRSWRRAVALGVRVVVGDVRPAVGFRHAEVGEEQRD